MILQQAIGPQPGPQTAFLSSPADIVIYGGAAGGGKTFGLLLDPLRYLANPGFGAVLFRRTYPELTAEGGIWDESKDLYQHLGATWNENELRHRFPSGSAISFRHLQHEKDKYRYKSAQIAWLGFDELTSFTRGQFFYLLSRNRSTCGVRPCVRAGTNPEPGWVADLIAWWLFTEEGHPRYGYPDPDKAGQIRYFMRDDDRYLWGDTVEAVTAQAPHLVAAAGAEADPRDLVKSLTFIPSSVYDNQILLAKDPAYLGNLLAQDKIERERLLGGNWLVRRAEGEMFNRDDFEIIRAMDVPSGLVPSRHWDLAGSEPSPANPDPDYTCGSKFAERGGLVFWLDCRLARKRSAAVEQLVRNTASQDGRDVPVYLEQEPGQSGKSQIDHYARNVLKGYAVHGVPATGSKSLRAQAPAAASGRGEIKLVAGDWNEAVLTMLDGFPDASVHDDPIDTLSQFWATRMIVPDRQPTASTRAVERPTRALVSRFHRRP